jgi:hypothetical protein
MAKRSFLALAGIIALGALTYIGLIVAANIGIDAALPHWLFRLISG